MLQPIMPIIAAKRSHDKSSIPDRVRDMYYTPNRRMHLAGTNTGQIAGCRVQDLVIMAPTGNDRLLIASTVASYTES